MLSIACQASRQRAEEEKERRREHEARQRQAAKARAEAEAAEEEEEQERKRQEAVRQRQEEEEEQRQREEEQRQQEEDAQLNLYDTIGGGQEEQPGGEQDLYDEIGAAQKDTQDSYEVNESQNQPEDLYDDVPGEGDGYSAEEGLYDMPSIEKDETHERPAQEQETGESELTARAIYDYQASELNMFTMWVEFSCLTMCESLC